ncbi:MAG: hypothetical protein GX444_15790 [Myxococcales bacterium]|nr:hypothetical protein [Myxococcales bacterium]
MKFRAVHAIPHYHSDLEWWKTEGDYAKDLLAIDREVVAMLARHPEFTYVLDQAFSVQPLQREDPEAFRRLREFTAAGRVEAVGSWLAAPDHNLPTGEALVRNLLYGKRWWRDHLGQYPRVGWGLDTFGHPPQLPQLLRKSGMPHYLFTRGLDPFDRRNPCAFVWEAPDGSAVLSFWLVAMYAGLPPLFKSRFWNVRYHFREVRARLAYEQPHNAAPVHLIPFGFDFLAPSESWVDFVRRWRRTPGTTPLEFSLPSRFFAALEPHRAELPVRRAEMNPLHSGGYESRHRIKQLARDLEQRILAWERLATAAWLSGAAYPAREIGDAWRELIKNDFHDTINGTPIDPAMREAFARGAAAAKTIAAGLAGAMETIAARLDTSGASRDCLLVFNPLTWPRSATISIPWEVARDATPVDSAGRPLPAQATADGLLTAVELPALGVVRLELSATPAPPTPPPSRREPRFTLTDGLLRADIDARGLCGLADVATGRELLRPGDVRPGGVRVLADFGNLWTVALTGEEELGAPLGQPVLLESGPLRSVVAVRAEYPAATVETRYALLPGRGRLEVETRLTLRRRDRRILAWLPLAFSGELVCETPYHATPRAPGHWPSQGWAGVFGADAGLAVLNRGIPSTVFDGASLALGLLRSVSVGPRGFGKFVRRHWRQILAALGRTVRLGVLGINLFELALGNLHWLILREYASGGVPYRPGLIGPRDMLRVYRDYRRPADAWDLGEHEFHYALLPTRGRPAFDELTRRAREFALPPLWRAEPPHAGDRQTPLSLWRLEGDAICDVLKPAEDSPAIVLRAYDASGRGARLVVDPGVPLTGAHRVSLGEDEIYREEPLVGGRLEAALAPWEIATFVLRRGTD